jgi:hypothetical protein
MGIVMKRGAALTSLGVLAILAGCGGTGESSSGREGIEAVGRHANPAKQARVAKVDEGPVSAHGEPRQARSSVRIGEPKVSTDPTEVSVAGRERGIRKEAQAAELEPAPGGTAP